MTRPENFYPWNMGHWVLNDAPRIRWLDREHLGYDREYYLSDGSVALECVRINYKIGGETIIPRNTVPAPEKGASRVCVSPDGKWKAFVKDCNVWLRDRTDGAEWAATTDGEPDNAYGQYPQFSGSVGRTLWGTPVRPGVQWSPDASRLLICRTDLRQVRENDVLQHCVPEESGSIRPVLHRYRCPFAGEPVPLVRLYLYDPEMRSLQKLELPDQPSLR